MGPRDAPAVDDVGIERIRRDVPVLLDAHRSPIAKGDLAVRAAADDSYRTAFLLGAVDPVGESVVGDHMVKLRGRLVVPGAPGRAAVEADSRPLIAAERDDARIAGVNPDTLVIVSAR